MSVYLELNFATSQGRVRSIKINNPVLTLTDGNVRDAMISMVASRVLDGVNGRATAPQSAALVQTTVTPITLP